MERRTTVVADDDDLTVLAHAAKQRGTSLGRMLGELVAREAEKLRRRRRPRIATFDADVSVADVDEDEPALHPFRS